MVSNTNPETVDPPIADNPIVWEYFDYPLEWRRDPNCGQSRHHYTPNLRLYINSLNGSLFLFSCFFCHHVGGVSVWGPSSAVSSAGHFQHIAQCTFLIFSPSSTCFCADLLYGPAPLVDTTLRRMGSFHPVGLCRQSLPLAFPLRRGFSALLCQTCFDL